MGQAVLKRVGVLSTAWLFAALWFAVYFIPLCVYQFWGKDCGIEIYSPFIRIQPSPSIALVYLIVVVPLLGFLTGIVTAIVCNLTLRICGGIKLEIVIVKTEPEPANVNAGV